METITHPTGKHAGIYTTEISAELLKVVEKMSNEMDCRKETLEILANKNEVKGIQEGIRDLNKGHFTKIKSKKELDGWFENEL